MWSNFKIDSVEVGDNAPCYFIADIAANHDGDLERAKDLIFLAAEMVLTPLNFNISRLQRLSATTV